MDVHLKMLGEVDEMCVPFDSMRFRDLISRNLMQQIPFDADVEWLREKARR